MKIWYESLSWPLFKVHLEAETGEERLFLHKYFHTDLKKLAKKFPLYEQPTLRKREPQK